MDDGGDLKSLLSKYLEGLLVTVFINVVCYLSECY